jgi:hypothetical protein
VLQNTDRDYRFLVGMFEKRFDPLEHDVVIAADVAAYMCEHVGIQTSAHRVGVILKRHPFKGESFTFRVGAKTHRATILRGQTHWKSAYGKAVYEYARKPFLSVGADDDTDDDLDPLCT